MPLSRRPSGWCRPTPGTHPRCHVGELDQYVLHALTPGAPRILEVQDAAVRIEVREGAGRSRRPVTFRFGLRDRWRRPPGPGRTILRGQDRASPAQPESVRAAPPRNPPAGYPWRRPAELGDPTGAALGRSGRAGEPRRCAQVPARRSPGSPAGAARSQTEHPMPPDHAMPQMRRLRMPGGERC